MINFDTIIIGGGLAGLVCGIRLLQEGQRCAIISSGQSAIQFSSGSFDLLNALPDGKSVECPAEAISGLTDSYPNHPYSKIGKQNFVKLAGKAKDILNKTGVEVIGDAAKNHYRITPMGIMKPTWLTLADFPAFESKSFSEYKSVAIFNIAGFLDFYPLFIAGELYKMGCNSNIVSFTLPDLDMLRRNPSEMRSTNIARLLDKKENVKHLAKILIDNSKDSDAVVFPAVIGLSGYETFRLLQKDIRKPLLLMPVFPPSVGGVRTQQTLQKYFTRCGGTFLPGDTAVNADILKNKISKLYSFNHGDIPFRAANYVLATGSYFSRGLISTPEKVFETVFGLDVSFIPGRQNWYDDDIFKKQEYQSFGVKTDASFNGILNEQVIDNLFVVGAVLEGFNPLKEGSGGGVSLLSALHVAENILK